MRRWNGWGDEAESFPLPSAALPFLERVVGPASPPRDASLADALAAMPASRLPDHRLLEKGAELRLRHARGQSLPDWVALRSGRLGAVPDAVALPTSAADVKALLALAAELGAAIIPYGGGTSVVGHVNPIAGPTPTLTVDLARMSGMLHFDERSQLATFGAATPGPEMEDRLRDRGFTLGHFPQSFEYSTVGGWIATRSSGQQSLRYGRIESLFAGGRLETPAGPLELPAFPASAAGPDLRELVLGSEGRLGIITEATLRATRAPEVEAVHALFFPSWDQALSAARRLAQAGLPLAMLRVSTPEETETNLALAGHRLLIRAFERVLAQFGSGAGKCMLLIGFAGERSLVAAARAIAVSIARAQGAIHVGRTFGKQWDKNRFRSPYLRNSLWERGYAVDTLETAAPWSQVTALVESVGRALREGLAPRGERVHVFTHLSHVYPTGSSIYTTYLFRLAPDPDETLDRWRTLKQAATRAIVEGGGTVSHQHGVGLDHRAWLAGEKGPLGAAALRSALRTFDPDGRMNPGKLLE